MPTTTTTNTAPTAADLRMVAFMLARALRAIRSERWLRASEMLGKTMDLIELLPHCDEKARACTLVEHVGMVGFLRELELTVVTEAA